MSLSSSVSSSVKVKKGDEKNKKTDISPSSSVSSSVKVKKGDEKNKKTDFSPPSVSRSINVKKGAVDAKKK